MIDVKKIIKVCKKHGYKSEDDLCDFWFKKENKLKNHFPNFTEIRSQIRWKSSFGRMLENQIRLFIENKIQENNQMNNSIGQSIIQSIDRGEEPRPLQLG